MLFLLARNWCTHTDRQTFSWDGWKEGHRDRRKNRTENGKKEKKSTQPMSISIMRVINIKMQKCDKSSDIIWLNFDSLNRVENLMKCFLYLNSNKMMSIINGISNIAGRSEIKTMDDYRTKSVPNWFFRYMLLSTSYCHWTTVSQNGEQISNRISL